MKNLIRGVELTIIASPLVGLVAIRMNQMIMSGDGADSIYLVIGLVGSVAFVGFWIIASMASDWLDAHSRQGVLAFAERHRLLAAIIGQVLVGAAVLGVECLSCECRRNLVQFMKEMVQGA